MSDNNGLFTGVCKYELDARMSAMYCHSAVVQDGMTGAARFPWLVTYISAKMSMAVRRH